PHAAGFVLALAAQAQGGFGEALAVAVRIGRGAHVILPEKIEMARRWESRGRCLLYCTGREQPPSRFGQCRARIHSPAGLRSHSQKAAPPRAPFTAPHTPESRMPRPRMMA